jgi:hypothetical protein
MNPERPGRPASPALLNSDHALALIRMDEIRREMSGIRLANRAGRGRTGRAGAGGPIAGVLGLLLPGRRAGARSGCSETATQRA